MGLNVPKIMALTEGKSDHSLQKPGFPQPPQLPQLPIWMKQEVSAE